MNHDDNHAAALSAEETAARDTYDRLRLECGAAGSSRLRAANDGAGRGGHPRRGGHSETQALYWLT